MKPLENNLIRLRAAEPADVDVLYGWENDTSVWRVSGTMQPFSRYAVRRFLENAEADPFKAGQVRLMIETLPEGRSIGTIDLFDIDARNRRAGVGILIADAASRGRGFASAALSLITDYAFEHLLLRQLYCDIETSNTQSLRLFEGCGFTSSGVRRQWLAEGDGFEDVVFMQLIR